MDGLQEVRGVKPTDGIKTDAVLKRPAGTETGDGGYDEGEAVEDFMADPSNWITK
ncbi:hypothetical protein [Deinococcus pimensis]|uniref:hypothetical protein n=1 Tax=Deinococcus pimensis TaxID=309888 RepID=UPI0004AEB950|nr:hypothetical protein [Deinococcus pimensis]